MTEPFPRHGLPHPTVDPTHDRMVAEAESALRVAKRRVSEAARDLDFCLRVRDNPHICRCCDATSLAPFGPADENQCAICWNGIHGLPSCKHPKGHLDHG